MKLIAIILNYNTPEMTLRAVDATIVALTRIPDSRIVIVDNASTDNSKEILEQKIATEQSLNTTGWENVELLISNENGGFGAGNNLAINQYIDTSTPPEYFYIQNSDAFPKADAVVKLIDYLDLNQDAGFAGSYIYGDDGEPHTTAFRFPTLLGEFEGAIKFGPVSRLLKKYVIPLGIPEKTQQVDWLAGASFLARTKTLEQIGVFDESFFLYYEETDLCRRAKINDWITVYVKESEVCHIGSASTGMKMWNRIPHYWLDSRRYYLIKNHGQVYFLASTLFKSLGEMAYRLRVFIGRKASTQPDHFIADLIMHTLRNLKRTST